MQVINFLFQIQGSRSSDFCEELLQPLPPITLAALAMHTWALNGDQWIRALFYKPTRGSLLNRIDGEKMNVSQDFPDQLSRLRPRL